MFDCSMINTNDIPARVEGMLASSKSIDQMKLNPNDWPARKLAASNLYDLKKYCEAAELLWDAPELPYRAQDIAFSVRIIAKGNRGNAIRLVNEVVKRNGKNAEGCLRLANAFHNEGLPLIASRMYGASLAVSEDNFDIGFEHESLWFDDHGELVKEWNNQACEPPPNEPSSMKEFLGKEISFLEYTQRITERVSAADLEMNYSPAPKVMTPKLAVPTPTVPLFIPKPRQVDEIQ